MRSGLLLTLIVGAIAIGCAPPPSPASRDTAKAEFSRVIEPRAIALLSSEVFDTPPSVTWNGSVTLGMQSGEPHELVNNRYRKSDRVLRQGKLKDGGDLIAEGYYSHEKKRFTSMNLIVHYTATDMPKRNIPVTVDYLRSFHVRPELAQALAAGTGSKTYERSATFAGKKYAATTATWRKGPGALEISVLEMLP